MQSIRNRTGELRNLFKQWMKSGRVNSLFIIRVKEGGRTEDALTYLPDEWRNCKLLTRRYVCPELLHELHSGTKKEGRLKIKLLLLERGKASYSFRFLLNSNSSGTKDDIPFPDWTAWTVNSDPRRAASHLSSSSSDSLNLLLSLTVNSGQASGNAIGKPTGDWNAIVQPRLRASGEEEQVKPARAVKFVSSSEARAVKPERREVSQSR